VFIGSDVSIVSAKEKKATEKVLVCITLTSFHFNGNIALL